LTPFFILNLLLDLIQFPIYYIMRTTLIAIAIIGMMTSCIESTTKMVIAHRVDGDTITTHKIKVDREFKVGEVVFPINGTNKFKIVRECRR